MHRKATRADREASGTSPQAIAFRAAILILPAASPRRLMTDIESPCNKVCTVDPISGLCIGCGRSLAEIESWIRYSADERAGIMAELPRRLAALAGHPAGRARPG
jgi:predicted Fe-S protein YdhL (DUF1289 family)